MAECNCRSWCRDLQAESQNGKYPPPNHAPHCNAYVLEEFTVLTVDGSGCVLDQVEAAQFLADSDDPTQYQQSTIKLTRDQFERLEEFEGW